jgi:hypothetical protein
MQRAPCPFLPLPSRPLTAASMHEVAADRGEKFYRLALECAQALWLRGVPAQSLLLINRALGADLHGSEPALAEWPLPYRAAAWVMRARADDQFIGNPRRHYQHLATRMVEPRRELRSWRAWACWHLARLVFPHCPADERQLAHEGVIEPSVAEITLQLSRLGLPGEVQLWQQSWTTEPARIN